MNDNEIAENAIMNMSVSERKFIAKDRDVENAVKGIIIDALEEARKQAEKGNAKTEFICKYMQKDCAEIAMREKEQAENSPETERLQKQLKEASSETKEDFEHEKIITEFADDSTERLMKEIENLKQQLKESEQKTAEEIINYMEKHKLCTIFAMIEKLREKYLQR